MDPVRYEIFKKSLLNTQSNGLEVCRFCVEPIENLFSLQISSNSDIVHNFEVVTGHRVRDPIWSTISLTC